MSNGSKTINILQKEVCRKGGVVILPLREYRKLLGKAIPTYYLQGKEAVALDRLVEEGLQEYKKGRTIKSSSLGEAMRIYARRQN